MDIAPLLSRGEVSKACDLVKQAIRNAPTDASLRSALYQLNVVTGKWDAALTQLDVFSELNPEVALYGVMQRRLLHCEAERRAVFAGTNRPTLFGSPEEWMGFTIHAMALAAKGEWKAAMDLQEKALEMAAPSAGQFQGEKFTWITDGDSRLGPILEAYVEGNYWWVPFKHLLSVTAEPPKQLLDTIWLPARFHWTNGGQAEGFLPVRYPGSETSGEPAVQLSKKTTWAEPHAGLFIGQGQKMLMTDTVEMAVMDLRSLELEPPVS